MNLSRKVEDIEISGIRKFYNKVVKVENSISLTLGEPDFKIPKEVKAAMKQAIDEDKTTYTSNEGIFELRKEISNYLSNMDIKFLPEEICLTVGGSEGLLDTFTAVLNPGDKVLIPSIAYPAYESCVKVVGGDVINYSLKDDLSIDFESLRESIKKHKPKAIVISYPSNPTGRVLTKKECEELHNALMDEELLIISDEMYSSIVFEEYHTISKYEDLKDRLILIGGFSKMFSMTGIRVGYVCAEKWLLQNIVKVHQYNVSCAPSIGQYGALGGLKNSMNHIEHIQKDLKERRDYVYSRLLAMGLEAKKPEGAFYIFPSIKRTGMTSEEFCEKLLNETKVAVVPGTAFGPGGEGYVRISYCYDREKLKEALNLMEEFLYNL